MMTKVINLFGGPGCGKSTTAAHLFALMKHSGYKVELVTEYAKELCYEGTLEEAGQFTILLEQYRRQNRLKDKVDYIITDSPLLLSLCYGPKVESFQQEVLSRYTEFKNIQILLKRVKPYYDYGRLQNRDQSVQVDSIVKSMLQEYSPQYYINKGNKSAAKIILSTLIRFKEIE